MPGGGNFLSPFLPDNTHGYAAWRALKLQDYPREAEHLVVEVADPAHLSSEERGALLSRCRKTNMAIYRTRGPFDKESVRALAAQLGLRHLVTNPLSDEDGITTLEVNPGKLARGYIPYSDKRLLWHTDGYYNPPASRIGAFILHCVRPASEGGDNCLLDPEMVYLRVRDAGLDHIRALMAVDVLRIPARVESGVEVRPESIGPVFAVDPLGGSLGMRYTARTRSIQWKQDDASQAAVRMLAGLMADDGPDIFRYRLRAGEGIVCNNVLHSRTAFQQDAAGRLLYRARYYDRIGDT
ncbi:MAG: TauD/TfdA family dioxygenase [Acidiferrobacteraceae bacterium]